MAIVEMSKIKLIGLSNYKERILNTLHKSACVEICDTEEIADTFTTTDVKVREELQNKFDKAKFAVDFITEKVTLSKDKDYYPKDVSDSLTNFFVSYDEFMSASGNEFDLLYLIDKIEDYNKRLVDNRAKKIKLSNLKVGVEPYKNLTEKFSVFKDTKTTKTVLGIIPQENIAVLKEFLVDFPLTELFVLDNLPNAVISLISFNEEFDSVNAKLSELSFNKCPFDFDLTPKDKLKEIENDLISCDEFEEKINKKTCIRAEGLKNLKILTDYYKFQLEKLDTSEKFRCTSKTFVLEGYLPKESEIDVKNSLYDVTDAIFIEYSAPTKDDNPPTLLKNNPIVRQSEFVTDMYSVPNYREMDPSKVVFFFFMLFMGVIMADVGYGVLMIVLGVLLARRIKVDNGTRRLWYIIAIGGIFTILFGVLFNSYFGVKLPYKAVLPDPVPSANSGMEGLMTILLLCLGLGVLQLAVGYACKAINCFKQGEFWDGVFDGIVWVLFFIGLLMAGFNFIMDYLKVSISADLRNVFDKLTIPGLVLLIGSVVIEALFSGRHEKGFGKFSKGFGAVYGLINLMSDILSYARLFGLMLSGMIIASTFNTMGTDLINGGTFGYVLGPLVILIGHVFNIAMGVLGAYIHDSRLQYIEFFGKFYTGEGEKFVPLGSKFDYIYLTR